MYKLLEQEAKIRELLQIDLYGYELYGYMKRKNILVLNNKTTICLRF